MKNLVENATTDLRWQKKELVNLKVDQGKLYNLKREKKRVKKNEQFQRPVGQHEVFRFTCNQSPVSNEEREEIEKHNDRNSQNLMKNIICILEINKHQKG